MESIKNDYKDHKLRWDLLPIETVENLVKVYSFGVEKYSENSWQNLPNFWERYKAALLRHLCALEKGELIDSESGLPHTSHLMWNAVALDWGLSHDKFKKVYKDIPGYEKYYYADTDGNIYSKDRWHNTKSGDFFRKGTMLKPSKNNKGYLNVVLSINGKYKTEKVHRLIAKTFIPNPNNFPEINHKNEDKTDNSVLNLEWCDRIYNMNYGTINQRLSQNADSKNRVKAIDKIDKTNNTIIQTYNSISSIREDGYDPSYIVKVCKGLKKEAYDYYWRYNQKNKQDQLLKALDKRIEEKVNNCNKILDEIQNGTN